MWDIHIEFYYIVNVTIKALFTIQIVKAALAALNNVISPSRISRDFFRFLWPKMTDFAVAFLKICGDICGISYCFSVKIYHGQHSSNIVITIVTSRTIIGLQTSI